ncbi:hypothetical protein GGU10DRAFT_431910 [Lentinula aff. detonsa]|uniref:Uncharacterized protein n=1 Tax=Lentinula aff. detonsa TaxID=2804958 RepID=A0AA38L6B6_9AGAR|nr:hypothetical protein GGU10DRAFT_431910 [Lentinula aff. detonsa]
MVLRNRNKLRICVAFYYRGVQHIHDDLFHTAILLLPKSQDESHTSRFHVTNSLKPGIVLVNDRVPWRYESLSLDYVRTNRLNAFLFLGKLSPEIGVEDFNAILFHLPMVQDDPGWNCNSWTVSAIRLLQEKGIINAPLSANQILFNGLQFASTSLLDHNLPVATCDVHGQSIDSLAKAPL